MKRGHALSLKPDPEFCRSLSQMPNTSTGLFQHAFKCPCCSHVMSEAEIRAVMIEYARLQKGGRLGKKYIRDNKDERGTERYERGVVRPEMRKLVPELAS